MSTEKFNSPEPSVESAPASAPKHCIIAHNGPPPFKWSSLWSTPEINPLNLKSYTLPVFNLRNQYGRNLHLSWLGFFVAFLSWFAFPPLMPEAIKADLKLTSAQVANSNIIALLATLLVRLILGPIVDRFGPRLTMAGILVVGAIPSGLAAVVTSVNGLYAIRFFIGILGGSFVPCVAWTTCFFDKNVVGTANALVGGWGNAGGGATFAVMVALFSTFRETHSAHTSWRLSFVAVPVPVLLFVALITVLFGTDHPAGKWSQRHNIPATALAVQQGHEIVLDQGERHTFEEKKARQSAVVQEANETDDALEEEQRGSTVVRSDVDIAVNEALTFRRAAQILTSPYTWLPALAYMSTFGFELFVDSNLSAVLLAAHPVQKGYDSIHTGYLASVFGLLNIFTRPLGGILADVIYSRWGVKGKKYFVLMLGIGQGVCTIGFGRLLQSTRYPSTAGMMVLICVIACFNEFANGANFALVPHCNAFNNGVMTGLVGAFGNVGGIWMALVIRFQPKVGHSWNIIGGICLAVNLILLAFPVPGYGKGWRKGI